MRNRNSSFFLFLGLLFLCEFSFAQDLHRRKKSKVPRGSKSESVKPSSLGIKSGLEWINGVLARDLADSSVNPSNRVLELPNFQISSDLRGDLQWQNSSGNSRFVLRPRFMAHGREVRYADTQEKFQKNESKWDLSEAFFDFRLTDYFSWALGLQNYQWGPAEFASPTNPFYHFNNAQRTVLFKEKGKVLNRLNFTVGESWSLVLMQEFLDNGERYWIAERNFEKKSLGKLEYRSGTSANDYLGLTYGEVEKKYKVFGLYGNLSFLESHSLYLDGRFIEGSFAYYPRELASNVYLMTQDEALLKKQQSYSIFGYRYEGDWDWRLEYIYNSAGYTKDEIGRARKSVDLAQIFSLLNYSRLSGPGLDLLGKAYVYGSLRIDGIAWRNEGNLFFRHFQSLQDSSGITQVSFDQAMGDSLVSYFEVSKNSGKKDEEFLWAEEASLFLGFRLSW